MEGTRRRRGNKHGSINDYSADIHSIDEEDSLIGSRIEK
jgi:hypothetical protein